MTQSAEYAAAMARSYLVDKGPIVIGPEALKRPLVLERGFQPLGITIQPASDRQSDVLLMASYFHPAILRLLISRSEDGGLVLSPEWIRGTDFEDKGVRIYAGRPSFSDMKRTQTAVHDVEEGCFFSNMNGDRRFWRFGKPKANGRRDVERAFLVPRRGRNAVHSAFVTLDRFFTVEANRALTENCWYLRVYKYLDLGGGTTFKLVAERRIPEFVYGVAMRPGDNDGLWLVTDYRCTGWEHGVWRLKLGVKGSERLMAKGFWGTGLGFLSDKTMVVARYGESHPDPLGGLPGALVFVPADMAEEP